MMKIRVVLEKAITGFEYEVIKFLAENNCPIQLRDNLDSNGLYRIIQKEILDKPYGKNLVALASDGASVMRGPNNSVIQKLKEQVPQLWDIHCLAHCYNLIASFASKSLHDSVKQLVKQAYNHFAHSSLCTSEWFELQHYMNIKPYKMLSWTDTRWSSLKEPVCRLLARWDALIVYFIKVNQSVECRHILKKMQKTHNKFYLQFLKIFLEKIDHLSKHFQKQLSQIITIEHYNK